MKISSSDSLSFRPVPFEDIAKDDYHLDLTLDTSGKEDKDDTDEKRKLRDIDFMVERNLRTLYESAHESGKDQMQVRLETKPVDAHLLNLFCFPFLSRNQLKSNPSLKGRYLEMLELMTHSPREALPHFQHPSKPQTIASAVGHSLVQSTIVWRCCENLEHKQSQRHWHIRRVCSSHTCSSHT